MSVDVIYNFGEKFTFQTDDGKEFTMNNDTPRPVQLLLIALLGCIAIDIVDILDKMKVKYEKFKISASGKRREDYPKRFEHIKITYSFYGKNLERYKEKIEKAVYLLQEKYCSIILISLSSLTKRTSLNAEYEIKLNDIG